MKYCESIFKYKRWPTRTVMVGNVAVGGKNPIRTQSMTTSNTRDVAATVEQIMRLADCGCEIARVTVQGMKEADACEGIKNELIKKGYTIPVVADIHFFPPAAMRVADFVDKVRINPGNFVDKRATFKVLEYDDQSYETEILKIEEKFSPLVEKCKKLKRAMRIGTNHGSLSDRIMNRYGDTPMGMVESALEFARVCRKYDFHDIIFSMKSSNPKVMIQAYRLLVAEMIKLGWNYPLHLGVTEAGQGEDGRVKSAMGIGALLLEGIGDTIRVSLTEDPWFEIDPCNRLVAFAKQYEKQGVPIFEETFRNVANIQRRQVAFPKDVALHRDGSVFVSATANQLAKPSIYKELGFDLQLGKPKLKTDSTDHLILREQLAESNKKSVHNLQSIGLGVSTTYPLDGSLHILTLAEASEILRGRKFDISNKKNQYAILVKNELPESWELIKSLQPKLILLGPTTNRLFYCRQFFEWLQLNQLPIPVILNFNYDVSQDDLIIHAAAECGALLCDGLGEGLCLEGPYDIALLRNLGFNILQAARMRAFKTDFISCPSCGRTLFDLQDVTKRIRARTSHLPGVKIAIMGCIVNGPGEMADADFGYVGSKPGMIDLYVGKECVEKDIPFGEADDRLIELIKTHGRWVEAEAM